MTMLDRPPHARPSFGRTPAVRGLDLFDTPPVALGPLFEHEPLLAGVTTVAEPFCGMGRLVLAMRERGLTVFASDVRDRGCPGATVLDFRAMTERPPGCDVLISNPAYRGAAGSAMDFIEHALALEFRCVVLLLKLSFLCTQERFERLHRPGHLRRVHVLAERLQDMHDANYTGEKAGQNQVHAWFVFDRNIAARPRSTRYRSISRRRACHGPHSCWRHVITATVITAYAAPRAATS